VCRLHAVQMNAAKSAPRCTRKNGPEPKIAAEWQTAGTRLRGRAARRYAIGLPIAMLHSPRLAGAPPPLIGRNSSQSSGSKSRESATACTELIIELIVAV
jgi:hypothetical protein